MGCAASVPKEEAAPPDPVPDLESLKKTVITSLPGEPELNRGAFNFKSNEPLELLLRKVNASEKGDSFVLEWDDKVWQNLGIFPAKPGIGMKKRLEDMVMTHADVKTFTGNQYEPVCLICKNVPQGLDHYVLLSPTPIREGQKPTNFVGPPGHEDMYLYASIVFNMDTQVCGIRVTGQGKDDEPLYTLRQCNDNVWVIKKKDIVAAAIQQEKGINKRFTLYHVLFCAGTDPLMMSLLVAAIDQFKITSRKTGWKFCSTPNGASLVFPPWKKPE
jgi:hypothetical protein